MDKPQRMSGARLNLSYNEDIDRFVETDITKDQPVCVAELEVFETFTADIIREILKEPQETDQGT